MTNSEVLLGAWEALEQEAAHLPGLYQRRIFAHSGFALFAGLVRPAMLIRLILGVPSTVGTEGLERETRGFRVLRQHESAERTTYVSLELSTPAFRELFEVMAEDVAGRILAARDEAGAVTAMRERLNRWERFMSTVGPQGLSREDQIGLFGELTFLRTLLEAGVAAEDAVGWWYGPARENQDFQNRNRVVEVKTTTGNSPTAVNISNELQLDESDCDQLFLFHLWLKDIKGSGKSLPMLVDEISEAITGSAAAAFGDTLLEAGYHPSHRALYEATGYAERERRYYSVGRDFPRIRRVDLRMGVTRVKYGIDLAGFERFRCDENLVIQALAGSPI
jgi:hypothetical protein